MDEYFLEKLKEFLVWLATVTTIILGINYFFTSPLLAIKIFFLIVLSFILYFVFRTPLIPIRVLQSNVLLDIKDKDGKEAVFTKTASIKTLRKHTNQMIEVCGADGTVDLDSFKIDKGYIDRSKIRLLSGLYHIPLIFDHTPKRFVETYTFTITGRFLNSHTKDREYFSKVVNFYTDKFILKVKFPRDRRCISYEGIKVFGTEILKEDVQPKKETEDGCDVLVWEINKPRLMYKYVIEWVW